jgi:hypothetical protein
MMVVSIAVTWLVLGLVVALVFGAAVSRTTPNGEEEVMPRHVGAELRYFRKLRRANCGIARDLAPAPSKKLHARHRVSG